MLTQMMNVALLMALAAHACPAADDLKRSIPSRESGHDVAVRTALTSNTFDANHILCPVLAAMWNHGYLKTDVNGSVEIEGLKDALMDGIGTGHLFAKFQATGIAGFDRANKETELVRNRCLDVSACGIKRAVEKTLTDDVKRWLNIFVMNGKQVNEHGISTGVRGGATNVPDPDECNGVYPCEARFQRFYVNNTDSNGRLYKKNLMQMVCTARKFGDRGGEYSYSSGSIHLPGGGDLIPVPAREWQMKGAILGWLNAFGRKDEKGEWYMHIDDARKMLMEGHLPKGWKKRSWGCLSGLPGDSCDEAFIKQVNEKVECDVSEDDPWWEGTGLQVATGHKCRFGRCDGGATCVEGNCICGRGSNLVGMIAKNGKCVERSDTCTYFGKKCDRIVATGPSAPGNPKAVVTLV